ncbi:MAG: MATE family efflux transporter [Eubacterium sp.]|nr:MATE family efflux transporter [Eubacterium sp.]
MKKDTLDLTQGNIFRQLIAYSLPLIATSLLQYLYSITDLLFAGRMVGSVGISAINNSSQVMNLITKIAIGLCTGGSILIGQYYGAANRRGKEESARTLFSMCLLMGLVFSVSLWMASRTLLVLLRAPALEEAVTYLRICSVGFLFIWGYNGLASILRALGDSRNPFRIIMATSLANILLDLLFMGTLKMGVAGAALATMLSQVLSFVLALILVLRQPDLYGLTLRELSMRKDKFLSILRLGIPCSLQMTIAAISWLVVTFFINKYGVDVSAGNGVSIKIKDICQLILSAMSTGTATMAAQNLGARLYDRTGKVLREAMKITITISLVLMLFVEVTAPFLCGLFTKEPAVLHAAVLNLRIEMVGQIFYAIFLTYHGFMTGAGHTMWVMFSSFINCIPVRIVLVIILEGLFGVTGIYLACMIAPFASVPIGFFYVRSGIWRRSLVNNA